MSDLSPVHQRAQARPVRAPRSTTLHCRNWLIEAAYRMVQNNLDPEVAENPDALVVYGGIGKAARNWDCFDAILESSRACRHVSAGSAWASGIVPAWRIERVLWNDPATGVMRHADAGYDIAVACARAHKLDMPMLGR